ncbi:hypothetical protein GCM10010372_38370 [Streptomyces tauricus]|nr:hypothetical protein [Streptomyces tauricus]GHA34592.1 hypothetical protein GCM10010372_38370 [Streptomyces tauricus]
MTTDSGAPDVERRRLAEADEGVAPWRRWGPYLSERQWGTVREDYSPDGEAWAYFTHDQARSRAYRWGEDGIAGVSDDKQRLCFALALWNGRDPILKERMFGLTNSEGNHGEDVKEYYFYLDSTPTHSYMKFLYKYPQGEFPYGDLVATNRARGRKDFEYELLDTGVFDADRYFDVFVEYAKAGPEDLLVEITAHNRGPEEATLHLLPTLWFRHTWSWAGGTAVPSLRRMPGGILAEHEELGTRRLYCESDVPSLFTENETNDERIFGSPNPSPYVKDGIGRHVVHGDTAAVNPAGTGTKAALHSVLTVPGGGSARIRLRLTDAVELAEPWGEFDQVMRARRAEADTFYDGVTPDGTNEDERRLVRQALAGMLWSKQYYHLDVERWLAEHGVDPLAADPRLRNSTWYHMVNDEIMSMPDTWEYPWYAAWDLAFHTLALAMVDIEFAKGQLDLLLRRLYLHPNGQIPAYEWNFGDVNPPVHAWATLFVYELEKQRTGHGDRAFLENAFLKLMKNFTWWLNRKDADGNNVFQGGFLGLDNIGVFDRSAPLPTGGRRPGRRDRLDGAVLPEPPGDRHRAGRREPGVRGAGADPVRALRVDRGRHEPRRQGQREPVGRGGRLLLRRPEAARRPGDPAQGALPRRADPARRHQRGRRLGRSALPRTGSGSPGVHRPAPGRAGRRVRAAGRGVRCARTASVRPVRPRPVAARPGPHARRGRVPRPVRHPLALPPPRRPPVQLPGAGADVRCRLSARRVRLGHVRRQLQLARPGVVPGQRPADPGPVEPARLSR